MIDMKTSLNATFAPTQQFIVERCRNIFRKLIGTKENSCPLQNLTTVILLPHNSRVLHTNNTNARLVDICSQLKEVWTFTKIDYTSMRRSPFWLDIVD